MVIGQQEFLAQETEVHDLTPNKKKFVNEDGQQI
jgi:hypothetical protein